MADEDIYSEEDIEGGGDLEVGGSKGGFFKEILPKVLKWVILVLVAIIFTVTVVVVTLRIMNRGTVAQSYAPVSEAFEAEPEILSWYGIEEVRTRTADQNPQTVIVKMKLGYEKESKDMQTDLIARTEYIYDAVRRYFSMKTAAELTPQSEEQIKEELKEIINRIVSSGTKVQEIVFMDFSVFNY